VGLIHIKFSLIGKSINKMSLFVSRVLSLSKFKQNSQNMYNPQILMRNKQNK